MTLFTLTLGDVLGGVEAWKLWHVLVGVAFLGIVAGVFLTECIEHEAGRMRDVLEARVARLEARLDDMHRERRQRERDVEGEPALDIDALVEFEGGEAAQ